MKTIDYSIDYALTALAESIKVVVVLGRSGCGTVMAAVDAHLKSLKYSSAKTSFMLRSILHRIFVPVHQAANGLIVEWEPDASADAWRPRSPDRERSLLECSRDSCNSRSRSA